MGSDIVLAIDGFRLIYESQGNAELVRSLCGHLFDEAIVGGVAEEAEVGH